MANNNAQAVAHAGDFRHDFSSDIRKKDRDMSFNMGSYMVNVITNLQRHFPADVYDVVKFGELKEYADMLKAMRRECSSADFMRVARLDMDMCDTAILYFEGLVKLNSRIPDSMIKSFVRKTMPEDVLSSIEPISDEMVREFRRAKESKCRKELTRLRTVKRDTQCRIEIIKAVLE